ncbi:radical SAM protein [Cellulosilyticum sp. I15G10I2]|uniref:radical SAM protein n=1 Tax=Cellulosilyticum sp. I15G10I2 TaxID=1892843 RepID=UPI00085C7410|nr:radical SAM protein [Cellulosilyticum sp. I15G10I2]
MAYENYITKLDHSIMNMFKGALKIVTHHPSLTAYALQSIKWQSEASNKRAFWEKQGIHVPPFMIASITRKCNLRCKGCYSHVFKHNNTSEMSSEKFDKIVGEASELGISLALIAGGEPFVKPEFLQTAKAHKHIIFPVFTNGLFLNDTLINELKKLKNVIPILSIEGDAAKTDARRGMGIYKKVTEVMKQLDEAGIFFGLSFTINRDNFSTLTAPDFVKTHEKLGAKLFFYVEYVPVDTSEDAASVISIQQRVNLMTLLEDYRSKFNSLFIAFPGSEEAFGGCLAAGRGFFHINPEGGLEPCPFSPYSDQNLNEVSLKEGLKSELFFKLQNSPDHLREIEGGCALWNNADFVRSLLNPL